VRSSRPPKRSSARDVADTGFSRHLDALIRQVPEALCAVFVDGEGESVDLSARVDAFDARITAAELAIVLASLRRSSAKQQCGEVLELRCECPERSLIARHVSEGYDLVVLVQSDTISARAAEMTAATAIALMVEAGLKPPSSYAVLRSVEQRPSRSGLAVPRSFEESGVRRRIEAVLGHRQEGSQVRYLVRLDTGEEMMIAHDSNTGRWLRSS
jgi:hypothetical protein